MGTADDSDQELAQALVALAGRLVDDYDVIDLLHRLTIACVRLLPVQVAGVLLRDQWDALRVVSSSAEQTRLLNLIELQAAHGPGADCVRASEQITVADLLDAVQRTGSEFATEAAKAGFRSAHAFPIRLRHRTIGALTLLGPAGSLRPEDRERAETLANVATITILNDHPRRYSEVLAEQLQTALDSRITVEQATGLLAERYHIGMDDAFATLRRHARDRGQPLTDFAQALLAGTTTLP